MANCAGLVKKREEKFSWAYGDRSQGDDHVAHAREPEYKNNTHYSGQHYSFSPRRYGQEPSRHTLAGRRMSLLPRRRCHPARLPRL